MSRQKLGVLMLVLVAGLLLVACGGAAATTAAPSGGGAATNAPAATSAPAATAAPAATEPSRKVATFIFTEEFDTLNPYYSNMWFSQITDSLWLPWPWEYDDTNTVFPVLVTEMPTTENGGISADGKTITMKLRDDIKWSDGEPITADDFVFTWQMVVDPNNTVASTYPFDQIASVTAPDAQTVVVQFNDVFVPWEASLWHGLLPKHILQSVYDSDGTLDNADWNRNPTVGYGPYVFQEWQSGGFARFVVNDNYWGPRPKIDEVFIRFVPDDASQINALVSGDGDIGTFIGYPDIPTLKDAGVNVVQVQSGYNEGWYPYMGPNGHPALQDVRVRQALAYAFDRQSLVDNLLLGLTKPAASYWDNTPYADPSIQPYAFDQAKANQLLDDAGWVDSNGDGVRDKDGVELELTYGTTTREVRQDTQAVAQQQLAQVGIKLDLMNYNSDQFFSGYGAGGPAATGQLDIMEWSDTTQYPDPDISYWLCSEIPSDSYPDGTNWQAFCDTDLDALFQQQATEADPATRQQTFYQISKTVFDKAYWIGLWQDPDTWAVSGRLQNVKISGVNPFYNIVDWDLTQ